MNEAVWPRRALGTAEHWGRVIESRVELLSKKQRQLSQSASGLSRHSTSSSEDIARAIAVTAGLAGEVEDLLEEMPRYASATTLGYGYAAGSDWTTVGSINVPRPDGKTNFSLSANAVTSTFRPVASTGPLFQWPFPLEYVTSEFGPREPLPYHRGIDFAGGPAVIGAPILAAADGVIIRNDYTADDWGWYVRIGHDAITGIPNNWTGYAHLNVQSTLPVGTPVTQGQVIGYLGNSGFSTGPHLHYETAVDNERINPRDFMSAFTGGSGSGAPPETAAQFVINGVPGNVFYPHSTRGFPGEIRQLHYLSGGGTYTGSNIEILIRVTGITAEIPADARNMISATVFGAWT